MTTELNLGGVGAPPSREEYAYTVLREGILSGRFLPEQVISQSEIARQLGISVIPVRTAISRLVAEGLMVQDAHRSPQISSFSVEELREILVIRMHLERLAIEAAIPHMTPEKLQELRNVLSHGREAAAANDPVMFGRKNREFHLTIYQQAPMPLLYEMIVDLWQKSDLHQGRAVFQRVGGWMEKAQAQHEQLLAYIEAGDVDRAGAYLFEHRHEAMERFMQALEA